MKKSDGEVKRVPASNRVQGENIDPDLFHTIIGSFDDRVRVQHGSQSHEGVLLDINEDETEITLQVAKRKVVIAVSEIDDFANLDQASDEQSEDDIATILSFSLQDRIRVGYRDEQAEGILQTFDWKNRKVLLSIDDAEVVILFADIKSVHNLDNPNCLGDDDEDDDE